MSDDVVPSLADWVGGDGALRRFLDAFYDRVEHDELIAPMFPDGVGEHHRAHITAWWVETFGGPAVYSEQHGGYERMLAHHRGLGITREQRFRFAALMSLAADDAGLPEDPEFRAALVGYVEWVSRLVLRSSHPGAGVDEHAPGLRWDWGAAPPHQR